MLGRRRRRDGGDAKGGDTFLPNRDHRRGLESIAVRLIATGGIIGIGTALAAILGTQDAREWIIGLAVATLSVLLGAILWSSRVF
jgi:hypothetical protein